MKHLSDGKDNFFWKFFLEPKGEVIGSKEIAMEDAHLQKGRFVSQPGARTRRAQKKFPPQGRHGHDLRRVVTSVTLRKVRRRLRRHLDERPEQL